MKNKLLKKTLKNFLIKIILWVVGFPLLFVTMDAIISSLDFQWLYDISPRNYYKIIDLRYSTVNFFRYFFSNKFIVFLVIIWISGIFIFIYKLVKKVFSYMNALSNASSKMMDKDTKYIELPSELEDLQKQMNLLKMNSLENERLALESEEKKNDLVVYLAHDLKTPLTSMIGYLSLVDEIKDMPKAKREKYINVALEKSYRLEELINELFDIARFNSEKIILEKESINLGLMLEQIIDDFYPILKEQNKQIKLNLNEKIILQADPDKLSRVFGNLIKNACSYSLDDLIMINVSKDEFYVMIEVINKGKKIPEEKLNKIFEKFYRMDTSRTSKTGGSGLGLAIAKEIVELHGGSIKAISDDEYTKFLVKLPLK